MDNIKKLGLTALAGSMVATAAHSAELSASGSWALSYTSEDDDAVNGQAFTMGDSVTFTGSGELDNGFTASVKYELDGGSFDDEQLKLDMGDMGEFAYGESNSGYGIDIASNMVPAVDTAIYSAVGTDTVSYGVARSAQDVGNLGYKIALDGGYDGLDLVKKVIYKSKNILKINGTLALEIGNEQINKVSKILINNNYRLKEIIKDYKNNVRCVFAEKNK